METLWQHFRYGFRMLGRRPGTTFVLVLTLALGIGANSAIFSVVDAVLLKPLPYDRPDQLVNVYEHNAARGFSRFSVCLHNLDDWRRQSTVFAGLAAYTARAANLTGGAEPRRVIYGSVSDDFFDVLSVAPVLGRSFRPDDAREAVNPVVVLSHGFWQEYFGGDPGVIDRTIRLQGLSFTIVGVMPRSFEFQSRQIEMWSPLPSDPALVAGSRGRHFVDVVARLKPGVSIEQAQTEMNIIAARLAKAYPASNDGWGVTIESLQESIVADSRTLLVILWAAVGLVLLIACSNVANILLAQVSSREKEVAIRAALGAGRASIIGQALAEGVLLGLGGGAAGLLIAFWGVRWLPTLAGDSLARMGEVSLDWRVVAFTMLVAAAAGLVVAVLPAVQSSKTNLNASLREAGRSSSPFLRARVRGLVVMSEVALAMVLLISASLVMLSFAKLWSFEPGFDSNHVLTFRYTLPPPAYPEREQVSVLRRELVERLVAMPEVESAAAATVLPLGGDVENWGFDIDGRPADDAAPPTAMVRHVSPGYLETMRIPLVSGRAINRFDRDNGKRVVVVSTSMAAVYWPGQDPLDQHIRFKGPAGLADLPWRVVGVAGDVPSTSLDASPKPTVYVSLDQWPYRMGTVSVVLRAAADPSALVARVRREIAAIDSDLPIFGVRSMDEIRGESVAQRRFATTLLGIFATVALLLAVVGLYGTIAFTVGQRTREIGLRMALGAKPLQILAMTVRQGMVLTFQGMLVGLVGAFALTRYLSSLLFGVSGTDLPIFAGVSAVLLGVTLVASWLPARRAALIEPIVALHQE